MRGVKESAMAGITTGPMAGKTVLVTGGTGGIGKAAAIGLGADGVPFVVEEVLCRTWAAWFVPGERAGAAFGLGR